MSERAARPEGEGAVSNVVLLIWLWICSVFIAFGVGHVTGRATYRPPARAIGISSFGLGNDKGEGLVLICHGVNGRGEHIRWEPYEWRKCRGEDAP